MASRATRTLGRGALGSVTMGGVAPIVGVFIQTAHVTFLVDALARGWHGPGASSVTTQNDAAQITTTQEP